MANKIVVLAKDEDDFIVDFIVHHLALGFDQIIVFDDLSGTPISEIIDALPDGIRSRTKCHRFDFDFYQWDAKHLDHLFDPKTYARFPKTKQMYTYNYAIAHCLEPLDWCAFIDADEFIWLGKHRTIADFRRSIQDSGYSAFVLDMLLYGHSFHLLPVKPRSVETFIWCALQYYGHGKFYAHVGAIHEIHDTHFPELTKAGLVTDNSGSCRAGAKGPHIPRDQSNADAPHLKHFIIQDVYSCFRRRVRPRISSADPMSYKNPSWRDRASMLEWTSQTTDVDLALTLLRDRRDFNLDITDHVRTLGESLASIPDADHRSAALDFDYLRQMACAASDITDLELLFEFFSQDVPDRGWLRFKPLPSDFSVQDYASLNPDLAQFSKRDLIRHYVNHGPHERRRYRIVDT